jgi:hypothetical protein
VKEGEFHYEIFATVPSESAADVVFQVVNGHLVAKNHWVIRDVEIEEMVFRLFTKLADSGWRRESFYFEHALLSSMVKTGKEVKEDVDEEAGESAIKEQEIEESEAKKSDIKEPETKTPEESPVKGDDE